MKKKNFFIYKDYNNKCKSLLNKSKEKNQGLNTPILNEDSNRYTSIGHLRTNVKPVFTWITENSNFNSFQATKKLKISKQSILYNKNNEFIPGSFTSSFFIPTHCASSTKEFKSTEIKEITVSNDKKLKDISSSPNFKQDTYSSIFNSTNPQIYNYQNSSSYDYVKFNFLDSFNKNNQITNDENLLNSFSSKRNINILIPEANKSPLNFPKFNDIFNSSHDEKILSFKRHRNSDRMNNLSRLHHSPKNISFFGIDEDQHFNNYIMVRKLLKKELRLNKRNNPKTNREVFNIKPMTFELSNDYNLNKVIDDLDNSIDSTDEEESKFVFPDLKFKFFKYFHFERYECTNLISFGENPLNHYNNLVKLFQLKLYNYEHSSLKTFSALQEIDRIKYSIRHIESKISNFPVIKLPSNEINHEYKANYSFPNNFMKVYKCAYCDEQYNKNVSLGGHSKLHSNFSNNSVSSLAALQLLNLLNLNKDLVHNTKEIKLLIKKNNHLYSKVYKYIKNGYLN